MIHRYNKAKETIENETTDNELVHQAVYLAEEAFQCLMDEVTEMDYRMRGTRMDSNSHECQSIFQLIQALNNMVAKTILKHQPKTSITATKILTILNGSPIPQSESAPMKTVPTSEPSNRTDPPQPTLEDMSSTPLTDQTFLTSTPKSKRNELTRPTKILSHQTRGSKLMLTVESTIAGSVLKPKKAMALQDVLEVNEKLVLEYLETIKKKRSNSYNSIITKYADILKQYM